MSTDHQTAAPTAAAEICRKFPLSEAAAKLLRADMKPQPFLELLIDKQHHADAVRFLAHSMPKRGRLVGVPV